MPTVDLVWVDEVDGDQVWAVNPWGVNAIDKNGADIFVVGEDGNAHRPGRRRRVDAAVDRRRCRAGDVVDREPDDNGVDDPPVAVDDPVTARSGLVGVRCRSRRTTTTPTARRSPSPSVGVPGHGTVEIGTASTVVYTPDAGYVGRDTFEYTIVDGNGTEDSATVVVELLPVDATNNPPVGGTDHAETGPGTPVVVEVLLNDVDPERDALAHRLVHAARRSRRRDDRRGHRDGRAVRDCRRSVTCRPTDSRARRCSRTGPSTRSAVRATTSRCASRSPPTTDANRAPIARPDAVRARRDVVTPVPVLVNDVDPDGDDLTLSVVEPLPAGLDVAVRGRRGRRSPFAPAPPNSCRSSTRSPTGAVARHAVRCSST